MFITVHKLLTQPSTAIFKGGIESSDCPASSKVRLDMIVGIGGGRKNQCIGVGKKVRERLREIYVRLALPQPGCPFTGILTIMVVI